MANTRRKAVLQPFNSIRNSISTSAVACMSYKELIRIVGVDPDLGPSSWRKAIDHSADTIVFYQVDLRASIPHMCKSIRICRETNGRLLLPSVYIGETLLSSSYVKTVLGRSHLADEDDLMKLLEHAGVLQNGEEIVPDILTSDSFLPESLADDLENTSPYSNLPLLDDELHDPPPKRVKRTMNNFQEDTFQEENMISEDAPGCSTRDAIDLTNLFYVSSATVPGESAGTVQNTSILNAASAYPLHVPEDTQTRTAGRLNKTTGRSKKTKRRTDARRSEATTEARKLEEDVSGAQDEAYLDTGEWDKTQDIGVCPRAFPKHGAIFTEDQIRFIIAERLKVPDRQVDSGFWKRLLKRMKERWPELPHTHKHLRKRYGSSCQIFSREKKEHSGVGKEPSKWAYFDLFESALEFRRNTSASSTRETARVLRSSVDGAITGEKIPSVVKNYDEDDQSLEIE